MKTDLDLIISVPCLIFLRTIRERGRQVSPHQGVQREFS